MIAEKRRRPAALGRVLALRLIKLVQRVRVLGYRLVSFLPSRADWFATSPCMRLERGGSRSRAR